MVIERGGFMKDFRYFLNKFYEGELDNGLFTTTNEKGENVILEITPKYLKASVHQGNGWIRINIYHKDRTVEELYER